MKVYLARFIYSSEEGTTLGIFSSFEKAKIAEAHVRREPSSRYERWATIEITEFELDGIIGL